MRQGLSRPFWLALVIAAFCLPLFVGLGRTDVENDEGIYSYAVDGILARGHWLDPLSSPHDDEVFLEKPPLKFWIVAAPIRLGLLPHDEFGIRFWDALFGAVAFLYVFALGQRLAGPWCGLVAVMVLFAYRPLLYQHGLRGNNMEAPLFLCYCGGIHHYVAWATGKQQRSRFRHILGLTLCFYLGFMTKFVAAFFLPATLAASAMLLPVTRRRLLEDLPRWITGAGLFLLLAAPWFVYQQLHVGNLLWRIIFGVHVFQRFTSSVDPAHVHPWNYYYVVIIEELRHMGTLWVALAGTLLLVWTAWKERGPAVVTVLAWMVVPLALMCIGTSKLPHYAYPFLPPIALAVGYVPGWTIRTGRARILAAMTTVEAGLARSGRIGGAVGRICLVLAVVALGIAAATLMFGSINWKLGGAQVVRNSHVSRPLILALVLATLGGRGVAAARFLFPAALLLYVMPWDGYKDALRGLRVENHPVRSARDCLMGVRDAEVAAGRPAPGIYAVGEQHWFLHSYYYYLHDVGGWERTEALDLGALQVALFEPGHQRPVMIDDLHYRALKTGREAALRTVPIVPLREVLLLMPGPYAACGPTVLAQGPPRP